MAKLKQDLQSVTRELKALIKKTERLMKAVDKLEKRPAAKKPKAKTGAKAKRATKAVAKKTTKATARKKAPAKRKTVKATATDQVLTIIKRSKKGVDVPTLMKKTGFGEKKVRNIVARAFSQKKISRASRGAYTGA
jgi:predicted  nucleic acid-binding Zn-ribbon protein